MCSIAWWHLQWAWRAPNPVLGNHTQSIEWYHFQWPWVTSDPDFKVTIFFEVEYLEISCLKEKVAIVHWQETIPNIWNGTMLGDLDWPLNALRGFVSISWASCFWVREAECATGCSWLNFGSDADHNADSWILNLKFLPRRIGGNFTLTFGFNLDHNPDQELFSEFLLWDSGNLKEFCVLLLKLCHDVWCIVCF